MPAVAAGSFRLLSPRERRLLAEALGDTPETVITGHLLTRGTGRAYGVGDPSSFAGAVVQAVDWPAEPTGYGSPPPILWKLLKMVEGWSCILVDTPCAPVLGEIIEREMRLRVRYLDDVCHTLTGPVSIHYDETVRPLSVADLALLDSAPLQLRASFWPDTRALLSEGIVACAFSSGRIVSTALVAARSERFAEIGVYTHQDFRCRGLAAAAASLVAQRVQDAGQTPVWSAGAHNQASLRVARKLGFREVSRRTYVILDR